MEAIDLVYLGIQKILILQVVGRWELGQRLVQVNHIELVIFCQQCHHSGAVGVAGSPVEDGVCPHEAAQATLNVVDGRT
ncbi:BQ5605_C008g05366 [Microbotryum silenes-dioicae]|uniref:BQ5605_C008g05366 protein n=1 Tax=Microbotryum silenes-dioicae TaxID=796604 RepID=A0A2X0MCS2_9BASI|nr:BQ5605_C008g05366 [Microbotryum silenes-dioicae]